MLYDDPRTVEAGQNSVLSRLCEQVRILFDLFYAQRARYCVPAVDRDRAGRDNVVWAAGSVL